MLNNNLAILIAGIGYVGLRHLRNLKHLGYNNIILYRSGKGVVLEEEFSNLPVKNSLQSALSCNPIGVIISNPTALHLPVALEAAQAGCQILLEKPVSDKLDGMDDFKREVLKNNVNVLVGYQFRFHPVLQQIKKWIDSGAIGRIISLRCHWGEYLPLWHPHEDYRRGYSARADLGGGVVLTLSHPFDYLRWLIGEVASVFATIDKSGSIEIDVEDVAEVLMRFKTGAIASVHLDYLQQPASHCFDITGQKGFISWDNSDGTGHIFKTDTGKGESFSPPPGFERNTMFLEEMRHFLNCVSGKEKPLCTLDDGICALKICVAVKRSAAEKKEISLN